MILLKTIFARLLRTFVHNTVLCYFSTCILVKSFLKRVLKQNLNKNGPVGLVLDLGPHSYNINTGRHFITSFSSGTRISSFFSGLGNLKTDSSTANSTLILYGQCTFSIRSKGEKAKTVFNGQILPRD